VGVLEFPLVFSTRFRISSSSSSISKTVSYWF
jgi:hypothetical protein